MLHSHKDKPVKEKDSKNIRNRSKYTCCVLLVAMTATHLRHSARNRQGGCGKDANLQEPEFIIATVYSETS